MANILAHARTQDQSDQVPRLAIQRYKRRLSVKDAASRETHDVVKEAQRSAQGVILIVDLSIDVAAIRRGNHGGGRLVVAVGPGANFNFGMNWDFLGRRPPQRERHEQALVALESRIQKRTRNRVGLVRQELRLHPMDPRRLLQSLDNVGQKPYFDFASVWQPAAVRNVQIANHSLVALIHKERVTENPAAVDCRISRQNFRVDVAKNHFRRSRVVPRKQARPKLGLVLKQRTQINGRKVPEVENLQEAPAAAVTGGQR